MVGRETRNDPENWTAKRKLRDDGIGCREAVKSDVTLYVCRTKLAPTPIVVVGPTRAASRLFYVALLRIFAAINERCPMAEFTVTLWNATRSVVDR